LGTEVKIVQEGIALRTYVYEAGIESGHQFSDFAQIDVAHRVTCLLAFFVLVFHQILVFEQGYRYFLRLYIDDEFASHISYTSYCFYTLKEHTIKAVWPIRYTPLITL
jgi:hypothetical protein